MRSLSRKVCLLGDFAVGKTSLINRYVYSIFEDKYVSTVGVKVSRKIVTIAGIGETIQLTMMLWDLADIGKFHHVQPSYLGGVAGAILVCDLTRPETLENLRTYAADVLNINSKACLVLAANKQDLVDRHLLTSRQIKAFAAEFEMSYYLTSAKTGTEVEALFQHMGQVLLGQS